MKILCEVDTEISCKKVMRLCKVYAKSTVPPKRWPLPSRNLGIFSLHAVPHGLLFSGEQSAGSTVINKRRHLFCKNIAAALLGRMCGYGNNVGALTVAEENPTVAQ
jgi:hypothetical protein